MKKIKTVPLVLQYEAVECGAASLSMILRSHGKYMPLGEIRIGCAVTRDGSNLKNLTLYAKSLGLTSQGKRIGVKTLSKKEEDFFPCICFWRNCHFLVLEGVDQDGRFNIADPAGGKYSLSQEEFAKSYSTITVTFTTNENFVKSGKKESEIGNFLPYLKLFVKPFIVAFAIAALLVIPSLAIPGMSGIFLNDFLQNNRMNVGIPIIWLSFIAVALNFGLKRYQSVILRRVLLSLQRRLSLQIAKKLFSVNYNFFLTRFAGDVANRLLIGLEASNALINELVVFILGIASAFILLPFVLLISWQLTLLSLVYVGINIFLSIRVSRVLLDTNKSLEIESGKMGGLSIRMLTDIETIKASGLEQNYLSAWQDIFAPVQSKTQYTALTMAQFTAVNEFINSVFQYGTITVSGFLVMAGEINLAGFIAFQALRGEFVQPLLGLGSLVSNLQQTEATLGRLTDLFSVKNDIKVRTLNELPNLNRDEERKVTVMDSSSEELKSSMDDHSLVVKDLKMAFSPIKPPFIDNIDFCLPEGKMMTIVGKSGCGKSTLIKLLTSLIEETSGDIYYGNSKWLDYEDHVIRGCIGYVSQEVVGLRDTIENNIKLFRPDYSLADVREASSMAMLDDLILSLPNSYSTLLGDGGSGLSGGQLQRLEIARALLKKPKILFLDEATSALDVPTEKAIFNNLKKSGITIISVAHRLVSAEMSDFILYLDDGKQVEFGPPDVLKNQAGYYSKLYSADSY